MYRRYYDGYNTYEGDREQGSRKERGEVVVPEAAEPAASEMPDESDAQIVIEDGAAAVHTAGRGSGRLFGALGLPERFELDDLLLLGVIFLLLHDSVDDSLLLIVLAVVFLAGFLE